MSESKSVRPDQKGFRAAWADVEQFVPRIHEYQRSCLVDGKPLFETGAPIVVARAPGRLDVMGGIADYSGLAGLAMADPRGHLRGRAGRSRARIEDRQPGAGGRSRATHSRSRRAQTRATARRRLRPGQALVLPRSGVPLGGVRGRASWSCLRASVAFNSTAGFESWSTPRVPEGKGVSSSAALEVATMQAVARLVGSRLKGTELAQLCQMAENLVVGAPCGIMDQMTSALGRADALLALHCQPAEVQGFVELPASIGFWGIDSGIRHAVSGSDYTSVRTGAFMGYRMIAQEAGLRVSRSNRRRRRPDR